MNKQELIGKIKSAETLFLSLTPFIGKKLILDLVKQLLDLVKQLDEPQPIKLKDVIARIKQLDIGTRKVWLDGFLNELGSNYGTMKYKDGYEQGKLEGTLEREKVTIPQFVADWLEKVKNKLFGLNYDSVPSEIYDWVYEEEGNLKKLHIACVIGYTVEKEKRYRVKVKGMNRINGYLAYNKINGAWYFGISGNSKNHSTNHTRKELEEAGFGWVFNCPGVEIEEVE
ncbi:DUF1642 domain-containing protein [Salmonella enterica]|nr:DUF1642 domain-containing protein [Salmonella enterica]